MIALYYYNKTLNFFWKMPFEHWLTIHLKKISIGNEKKKKIINILTVFFHFL